MKCIVLVENTKTDDTLFCEHGLSLWIETGNHVVLFDTGQSDAFYNNALTLGLDLNRVDICILSHGHYDHGGGLKKFLEVNDHASIYVHEKAFESHWHGYDKYIGIDPLLKSHPRIVFVKSEIQLDDGLRLIPCEGKKPIVPVESYGLFVRHNDFEEDSFDHEMVLMIEKEKKVLISGCTHKGILNVMHWFEPDVLIGGFHLKKVDPVLQKEELLHLGKQLKKYSTSYYTGHCTGDQQLAVLQEQLNDRICSFSTGTWFEISI